MPDTPMQVNQSALWGMVATFARDALKVAGGFLVTKGLASDSLVDSGAGLIIAVIPIVYSQLKTLWNHRKLVTLAEVVPDSVAQVK
jgi:hypothetical protein